MGVLRMILLVANYGFFVFNAFPIIILGVATILGFHLEPDSIIGALMVLLGLVFLGMAYVGHRLINWIIVPILPSKPPESPDDGWENKPDDPWGPPKEGGKS